MDFDKLSPVVPSLDPGIRYAAIQDHTGQIITGSLRENITLILNDDDLQMIHYYASQRWQTRKNIEHKIGPAKHALAEMTKSKGYHFQLMKNTC